MPGPQIFGWHFTRDELGHHLRVSYTLCSECAGANPEYFTTCNRPWPVYETDDAENFTCDRCEKEPSLGRPTPA
jgi:hypothetical protein